MLIGIILCILNGLTFSGIATGHVVHGFIYGAVLLLYGRIRMVGLLSTGLVPGGWPEVGARSDREPVPPVSSHLLGHPCTADSLRSGAGESRR